MRDYQTMKKYKIDRSKNIGNVIFVVEGGRADTGGTELRLLKNIFCNILGYEVQELRRDCDEFIAHGSNPQFRVFALNLPKPQLTQMTDDALDELYSRLNREFNVKPEDCPIFFLYDRDVGSYKFKEFKPYVYNYTDPYGDENGNQGQLLLSYPCIESYLLSCIENDVYTWSYSSGKKLKPVTKDRGISEACINTEAHLIHATVEMDKGLDNFSLGAYDLDHLADTLKELYKAQQQKYKADETFSLLSLVSMALLELGIIIEDESEDDT